MGSGHLGFLKSQASFAPYAEAKFLSDITYMLDFTTFIPNNANWGVYTNTWFEGMQAVESGDMTAQQAVDFVIERMQAELGDDVIIRWRWGGKRTAEYIGGGTEGGPPSPTSASSKRCGSRRLAT